MSVAKCQRASSVLDRQRRARNTTILLLAIASVAVAILAAACDPDAASTATMLIATSVPGTSAAVFVTETPIPTATTPHPAGTLTPVPVINSKGLGARRDIWEKMHGSGIATVSPDYAEYDRYLRVTFDDREIIKSIAGDYKTKGKGLVSLDAARSECLKLIPSDAVQTAHFDHPSMDPNTGQGMEPLVLVDLYNSKSLSTLFPPDAWFGEQPGTFYIQYEQYKSKGDQIGAFLMGLSSPP